ncbi:MAG: TIGR02996 domain-containing protein [Gemmataceae bacterium]
MTQQDALYRAVCEHPDEDTPRLVFADHLEDTGDARRAGFIRTQIQLARLPESDPAWRDCRRHNPDAIRGWMMAHTLPRLPEGLSWRRFRFKRGFPWLASVTEASRVMTNGERLFAAAPIQALELDHDCGIVSGWDAFVEWPRLAKLTRLEFTRTRLDAAHIRKLAKSPFTVHLRELCFEADAITADGLQALAESPLFPRLRRLELRNAALPPALAMGALAVAPPGLAELTLAECKFPGADVAWFLNQPAAKAITSLDLGLNPLRGEGVEAAAAAGCLVLLLNRTAPGLDGIRALARSGGRLRWLDLSGNRLGPAAVRLLAEAPFEQLVELDVLECGLDDESIRILQRRFGTILRTDSIHKTIA